MDEDPWDQFLSSGFQELLASASAAGEFLDRATLNAVCNVNDLEALGQPNHLHNPHDRDTCSNAGAAAGAAWGGGLGSEALLGRSVTATAANAAVASAVVGAGLKRDRERDEEGSDGEDDPEGRLGDSKKSKAELASLKARREKARRDKINNRSDNCLRRSSILPGMHWSLSFQTHNGAAAWASSSS
jgi:hypothetical protein